MFKGIRDAIFWNDDYESAWQWHNRFASHEDIHWRWGQRIQEKKAYWKELGKTRKLSARRAVYNALLELAEDLYREYGDKPNFKSMWPNMAYSLHLASVNVGYDPEFRFARDRLPDRWKAYYDEHDADYKAKEAKKKLVSDEMTAHRFEQDELEAGWQKLIAGEAPRQVITLWRLAYPRKAGHEIAYLIDFSLKDFVFWMVVYRQHYLLTEQVVMGTHMYTAEKAAAARLAENEETRQLSQWLLE